MKEYIATFYSHFGAVRFRKMLKQQGRKAKIMPVPRNLSSSCGSCVLFETDAPPLEDKYNEIEQIVEVLEQGYRCVYRASDS